MERGQRRDVSRCLERVWASSGWFCKIYKVLLQTKIVQDVKDKQSPVVPIRIHRHVDIICVWHFFAILASKWQAEAAASKRLAASNSGNQQLLYQLFDSRLGSILQRTGTWHCKQLRYFVDSVGKNVMYRYVTYVTCVLCGLLMCFTDLYWSFSSILQSLFWQWWIRRGVSGTSAALGPQQQGNWGGALWNIQLCPGSHLEYCYNNLCEGQVKFRWSHYSQVKHARGGVKLTPVDASFDLHIWSTHVSSFIKNIINNYLVRAQFQRLKSERVSFRPSKPEFEAWLMLPRWTKMHWFSQTFWIEDIEDSQNLNCECFWNFVQMF